MAANTSALAPVNAVARDLDGKVERLLTEAAEIGPDLR